MNILLRPSGLCSNGDFFVTLKIYKINLNFLICKFNKFKIKNYFYFYL